MPKGLNQELSHSKNFHHNSIPLLVSAQILRSRNLGQLDLVKLDKKNGFWLIEVCEVKSSKIGDEASLRSQVKRLKAASAFLASVLGQPVKLTKLVG